MPRQGLHPAWVALLALLAGALVTLSLAPFDLWPAGIASCALYCYLLSTCSPRQALWRGWLFGLGMFGSGVSWVYVSIHVYGYASVPLAAFLTALFCASLAVLHSLFAVCYVRWVRPLPGGMLAGFGALWVLFEWLRSWLLTGFPWLYLGYAHLDTWLAGWAPIVGVYGLSFAVALTGCCLFLAWRNHKSAGLLTYATLLGIVWLGGRTLTTMEWVVPATEQPLRVALYQPNIPQELKWQPSQYPLILSQYDRALPAQQGHDIVLWPESALPRFYQQAQDYLDPVAEQFARDDTTLITGIPWRKAQGAEYFNSIVALGAGAGLYHKQRLVPFGEYVPLEQWLRGLIAFFDMPMSSFSAGPKGQGLLLAGGFRVAPFICYEVVYPDLVAQNARNADLLVTISNDSWFGASIGPLQHLQMARMRALETGRYLLRGTNNGISAIIDHQGTVLQRSPQFEEALLSGEAQIMLGSTPAATYGTRPVISASALLLLTMLVMYHTFWRERD